MKKPQKFALLLVGLTIVGAVAVGLTKREAPGPAGFSLLEGKKPDFYTNGFSHWQVSSMKSGTVYYNLNEEFDKLLPIFEKEALALGYVRSPRLPGDLMERITFTKKAGGSGQSIYLFPGKHYDGRKHIRPRSGPYDVREPWTAVSYSVWTDLLNPHVGRAAEVVIGESSNVVGLREANAPPSWAAARAAKYGPPINPRGKYDQP